MAGGPPRKSLLSQTPSPVTSSEQAENLQGEGGRQNKDTRAGVYVETSTAHADKHLETCPGWSGVRHAGPQRAGPGAGGQQVSGNWEAEGHTLRVFKSVPRVLTQTRWLSTSHITEGMSAGWREGYNFLLYVQ